VAAWQSIRDNPYLKRTLRCRRLAQRDERRAGGPLPRVPASDSAIARATEANAACKSGATADAEEGWLTREASPGASARSMREDRRSWEYCRRGSLPSADAPL